MKISMAYGYPPTAIHNFHTKTRR